MISPKRSERFDERAASLARFVSNDGPLQSLSTPFLSLKKKKI